MTLYRSNGRGSWIVERVLLGVPVRRATGIYDLLEAAQVEQVLLKLAKHGRRDLIEAFDRDDLGGAELVAAVERYGVTFDVTVERATRLAPAVKRWLEQVELADSTRQNYRNGFAALQRGRLRASVADLPALLARYARRAKPVMFKRVKAAAQSFVSATARHGRHSDLWRDVAAVTGAKPRRRQVRGGLTPDVARAVAEKLGRLGPMWWTLCTTGMGRKEYWRTAWEVQPDRILVHGTKREHRDRTIPRLTTPVRPMVAEQRFAEALARAAAALGMTKLTIYVARRTYAHFLELAQIIGSRCDAYMGHSPKMLRDLYREHDVEPYLADDTKALRAVIGADPAYLKAVRA